MRGTGYWEVRKMGRVEEKEGRVGSLKQDLQDLWDLQDWESVL